MRKNKKTILSTALIGLSLSLFAQNNKPQYLKDIAPFPIGTAISKATINDPTGNSIILNEFNRLTPEFQMKIGTTNPKSKTNYFFKFAEDIVDYANENHKQVHGHALVYPMGFNSYPAWMKEMSARADSVEWENFMKERIQTLVKRYKAKGVKTWDVVNEAFLDNGKLHKEPIKGVINKENIWAKMLGDDYIARAFQYAHEADPEALLFYNDFGHEFSNSKKVDAIIAMVADFKKRGIPIHGIGLQMHTSINRDKSNIENALKNLSKTGLLIHISETTIEINKDKSQTLENGPSAERLQKQKQKYKEIIEAMRFIPKDQRFGFTIWGVSDKRSYPVRPVADWPTIWDDNYAKKPAYDGVVEGLQALKQMN